MPVSCVIIEKMLKGGWKMAGKRCIIPVPPVWLRRMAAAMGILLLACAALLLWPRKAGLPEGKTASPDGLSDYQVTLRLNAEESTLAISETILFRNDTGDALESLMLCTWLNAFKTEDTSPAALEELYDVCYPEGFSAGGVTVYDVLWNGERAGYSFANGDETALEIAIPTLQPGEEGTLTFRCLAQIPVCSHRCGRVGDSFQLGNVIPILAHYEDGAWRTDEYAPIGDPFLNDCADFQITAYFPEGYAPACSAALTLNENGAWQGDIRGARDAALCVSPDYKLAEGKQGNTAVYSYAKTEAGARRALDYARKALETFSSLYGAYPYPALTVCSVDFPFGGMEYPGLCMIGESNYLDSKAETLELTIAHEIAHQWFYALVGSDQAKNPWQDEALCEYAMLRYVQKRYGQSSFETLKYYRVDAPMQENLAGNLTPGSPIEYFGSLTDYATVVYGRGAALLLALDELLPKGTDDFLRAYVKKFAYQFVTRDQFEEFLNQYAGMDLRPLLLDYLDTAM